MSETKKRNQYAYDKKAYDHLHVQVPAGRKEEIKNHAERNGESLNGFVKRAIDETMERDNRNKQI